MRGSRGPRGFPRRVVRQYLGPSARLEYDLPHQGVIAGSIVAYDGVYPEPVTLVRGIGANGADQVWFPAVTASDAYATYTYIPGWRGED